MYKLLVLFAISGIASLWAAPFQIDGAHSKIEFKIPYLKVSTVTGTFNSYESSFDFDTTTNELKDINITINATSIDTGIEARDNHLRTADFFDVPNHPQIIFKAPMAIKKGNKFVSVEGEMILRGVTKKQMFTLEILEPIEDMQGVLKYPFKASTVVKRKEFNIGWNKQTKTGTWILGDDVQVQVEGMAMMKAK